MIRAWKNSSARFGTDDSCLVEGSGNGPELVTIFHGHDTMAVAGMGARFLQARRGSLAVDVVGIGSGVYDRLREQRLPGTVIEVQAGGGSDNHALLNMRAELWWNVRESLYRGELSLARLDEPTYQRLRAEFEFEHGGGEEEPPFIEWAYIDVRLLRNSGVRIGAILAPFNRFDDFHAPLENPLISRPTISSEIGVSAWKEVGIDFHGSFSLSRDLYVNYDAYVINGLGAGSP